MKHPTHSKLFLLSLCAAPLLMALGAPKTVAPSVDEPTVPRELAASGTVYHTLAGREAQITFTSTAPLENIVGKSNEVVGYAVAGPDSDPAKLVGARWLLPVASMATGIPLRDEHMAGDEWLDAEHHPLIEFELASVEDVLQVKAGDGYSTWEATLVGNMTMHGVVRPLRIADARLSFLAASDKTAAIAPGDLLFIKCAYSVDLAEFGIVNKDVPNKVSGSITLSQMLRLSTIKPTYEPATP